MTLIRIERRPSSRQLAVFAAAWAVFWGIAGGLIWAKTTWLSAAAAAWTVGAVVPAVGAVAPGTLRIVYLAAAYAAFPVGWVLSLVLLAAVYYLVLTPTGVLARLCGYDPLHRRRDPDAKTYWVPRPNHGDVRRYFRQF